MLVYREQTDPGKALALTRRLWWNLRDGQACAEPLLCIPLPPDAVKKAAVLLKSITLNGSPALPAILAGN